MERAKAAATLIAIFGASIGAGLYLSTIPGTKEVIRMDVSAEMADAGCKQKVFTCSARLPPDMAKDLPRAVDAGIPKYAAVKAVGWECASDAGDFTVINDRSGTELDSKYCEEVVCPNSAGALECVRGKCAKVGECEGVSKKGFEWGEFPCAWRPADAGARCTRIDGGNPGDENTMQPGEWVGPGCVRKSCFEFSGETSHP